MKAAFLKTKNLVLVSLLIFGFLNLFVVLLDHYYFRTVALDYAIYNFAFFDYAHLRITPVPAYIFPFPVTFLQDHFSLTLMFLAPLYWLMAPLTGTYSLLIIQWVFIVAGAIATQKLILARTNNDKLALGALLFYFLLFGRYSAYREDVNLAIIGSAMIPVFLYFFEIKKTVPLILTYGFLILNREDYGLWLFFICLFLMINDRKDKWKLKTSAILMVCSSLVFIFILKVIIPSLEDENKKYALFDFTIVGKTPQEAFLFIIGHPLEAIRLLFVNHWEEERLNGIKQNFYLVYLVSGGILLLFKPWYLIPFIPILCKKMYDDNPLRWSIETYYSVEFVSIMPVLVFMIIGTFKSRTVQNSLVVVVCLCTAGMTSYKMLVPPPNPIVGESNKYNVVSGDFYRSPLQVNEVYEVLKRIPPDAAVSGSCRLIPHLAYREKVYYFPKVSDAEFIVLFKRDDYYPLSKDDFEAEIKKLSVDPRWEILENRTDVILFRKYRQGLADAAQMLKKKPCFSR